MINMTGAESVRRMVSSFSEPKRRQEHKSDTIPRRLPQFTNLTSKQSLGSPILFHLWKGLVDPGGLIVRGIDVLMESCEYHRAYR